MRDTARCRRLPVRRLPGRSGGRGDTRFPAGRAGASDSARRTAGGTCRCRTECARAARSSGIAFLDTDVAVLKAHEDLGARVGVERRLKAHFELPRVEVLALDAL